MNNGHNAAGFTAEGSTTPDKLNPRDTIERKQREANRTDVTSVLFLERSATSPQR